MNKVVAFVTPTAPTLANPTISLNSKDRLEDAL